MKIIKILKADVIKRKLMSESMHDQPYTEIDKENIINLIEITELNKEIGEDQMPEKIDSILKTLAKVQTHINDELDKGI